MPRCRARTARSRKQLDGIRKEEEGRRAEKKKRKHDGKEEERKRKAKVGRKDNISCCEDVRKGPMSMTVAHSACTEHTKKQNANQGSLTEVMLLRWSALHSWPARSYRSSFQTR